MANDIGSYIIDGASLGGRDRWRTTLSRTSLVERARRVVSRRSVYAALVPIASSVHCTGARSEVEGTGVDGVSLTPTARRNSRRRYLADLCSEQWLASARAFLERR